MQHHEVEGKRPRRGQRMVRQKKKAIDTKKLFREFLEKRE
jgi:hypothetical protein